MWGSALKIALFVLIICALPAARAANGCFANEINPRTNTVFANEDDWKYAVETWKAEPHPAVGVVDLLIAYSVYRRERNQAEAFVFDKVKHCHVGCAIALKTSAKVADHVGWLKEQRDLIDCKIDSHFEPADAFATSQGARLGARDRYECATLCYQKFAPVSR